MSLEVQILGIPVRIHLWFAITALVIWNFSGGPQMGWGTLPIAVLVIFQGVLFHELGHALTGRAFGLRPRIDLAFFAGITRWEGEQALTPGKGMLVSVAGPLVGIVLGLLGLFVWMLMPPTGSSAQWALAIFVYVNLGWSLLNLVPILPLDGGNIVAHFLQLFSPRSGVRWARYISIVLVGCMAGALLLFTVADQARYELDLADTSREAPVEQPFNPLFFLVFLGMFGFMNVQALRSERAFRKTGLADATTPDELLALGYAAIERGDAEVVSQAAFILLRVARDNAARDEALHLLAWGRLLADRPEQALESIRRLSGERDADPALEGAVLLELGNAAAAAIRLRDALPNEYAAKRFVTAVLKAGEYKPVSGLAVDALDSTAWSQLQEGALAANEFAIAFEIASLLFDRANDPGAAFDAVRALARSGRLDDAQSWLERARQVGFADLEELDAHEDLAALRQLPNWPALRASFE